MRGKLALMDGDTQQAEEALTAARAGFPRAAATAGDSIYLDDWVSQLAPSRAAAYRTSQFYGDLGVTSLARDHYLPALTAFSLGAFREDAAYIAERVLSAEELLTYVRRRAGTFPADDPLPSLLGRRLARERYFKDARPFLPTELRPVFDRYVALRKIGWTAPSRAERAAALWEAAQIHRVLGLELFGTEGAPDSAIWGGNFEAVSTTAWNRLGLWFSKFPPGDWIRTQRASVTAPAPTADERARVRRSRMPVEERFHYRYIAADLAWKAATLMPDDSDETARVLGISGRWLADRDPQAADRFYKALVWRNWSTPLSREADRRRWFPPIAWDYDPWTAAGVPRPKDY